MATDPHLVLSEAARRTQGNGMKKKKKQKTEKPNSLMPRRAIWLCVEESHLIFDAFLGSYSLSAIDKNKESLIKQGRVAEVTGGFLDVFFRRVFRKNTSK